MHEEIYNVRTYSGDDMRKLFLVKNKSGGLSPYGEESEDIVKRWKVGNFYALDYRQARSPKHHRLVFGLAGLATKHSAENNYWHGKPERQFIEAVQLTYDIEIEYIMDMNGEMHKKAKSISFENMDEKTFRGISDLVFKEVARVLNIEESHLRENYEEIFEDTKVFLKESA